MSTVSRDISLNVIAEVERYAAGIGKIPGMTQAAAAKAATALGKELAKAETIALKNAGSAAKSATKGFGDLRQAAGALSPTVGRLAADFEDLVNFLGPGGAALGVIAAVGAAAFGFVKLTKSAAANSKELEKVGLLSRQSAEAIRSAANTIDTANVAWQAMSATLAEIVGGALQGFIRWTMIAAMAWDDFIHGRGMAGVEEYKKRVLEIEGRVRSLSETFKSALPAFDMMASAALELAAAEAAQTVAAQDGIDALKARREETFKLHEVERALAEERLAIMIAEKASDAEIEAARQRMHAAEIGRRLKERDLSKDVADQELAQRRAVANAWLSGIDSILGAMSGMVQEGSVAAKAIASLQVVVSTAAAFMNALATPPFPLGLALGVTALAAGAVSLANVWSAKPGQKSINRPSTGSAGNTRREQRQAERNARNNSGPSESGPGNYNGGGGVIQFHHRIYDDVTSDAMRRDSPLSQQLGRLESHQRGH